MTWINGLADSHPQHANFINITAEKLANVERELVALGPEIVVIPLNSVVLKSGTLHAIRPVRLASGERR